MADRVGQQFGNYKLIQQLGEGGFAEVYLGEHIHLGSHAAIKVLHSQLTSDDVEKFRNEARTIVRLVHPHIVRLLEFGIEGKTPFLVMDYAPNGTLRHRHPRGVPLPLTTVVSYVKSLADALQFAHDEKLIHRDIKPENILVGRRNEILLSDFGIAIVAQSSRYQGTQDMAGTIAYMAPEQIQAHPRAASDQYSLAIVVYEWLTGDRPFHGSFTEIAIKHSVVPPPPLREKLPTISPDIEQVVLTALAKDPKERFGSVQAFANALEQASQPDVTTFVKPIVPKIQVAREEKPSKPLGKSIATPPLPPTELAIPSRSIGTVLFTYRGHSDSVNAIVWSPDGKYIVSGSSDKSVRVWDILTNSQVFIHRGHSRAVNAVAWFPDGKYIASSSDDKTVQIWNVATGEKTVIYNGHSHCVSSISWSPNGKYIASGSYDKTVHVWTASAGRKAFTYQGHSHWVTTVSWSPDGRYIVSGSDDGIAEVWEGITGGKVITYSAYADVVTTVSWSPDGKRVASAGYNDKTVRVWNVNAKGSILNYNGHSKVVNTVSWSPDGKRAVSGSDGGIVQVWETTTGNKVFTYQGHSGNVNSVAWSPNGKYIASAGEDKTVQVWVAP